MDRIDKEKYYKPRKEVLQKKLSDLQYRVAMEDATERPFTSEYWDSDEPGIYVDITTGEPLFSSRDKFTSRCGWPSFSKPIGAEVVNYRKDLTHGMERTEVRSHIGDIHLGHVFEDGPKDRGGLRYCINGASLRFIPYDEMEKEGYGSLKKIFDQHPRGLEHGSEDKE